MVILSDHVDEEKSNDSSTTELVSLLSAKANTEKAMESMITRLYTHLSVYDLSSPLTAKKSGEKAWSMWQKYKDLTNLIDTRHLYRIFNQQRYTMTHTDDPRRPGPQHSHLIIPKNPRPPLFPPVNLPRASTSTLLVNSFGKKAPENIIEAELEVKISKASTGLFYTLNDLEGNMGVYTNMFPLHHSVTGSICSNLPHMSGEVITASMGTFFFGRCHANHLYMIRGGAIKVILGYENSGTGDLEIREITSETGCIEIKKNYRWLMVASANCWEQFTTETEVVGLVSTGPKEDIAKQLLANVESENKGALVVHF